MAAKRMRKRPRSRRPWYVIAIALVLAFLGWYAGGDFRLEDLIAQGLPDSSAQQAAAPLQAEGETLVYYLDVGQGDSELIQLSNGKNILIDAGTRSTAEELVSYLENLGVQKIDYLIATHPHEDHIGGMTDVVQNFEIGSIYMPKIADSQIPTTKVYENLLMAIDEKGLSITAAQAGSVIFEEAGARMEILAPNSQEYSDLNSYSIVTKLTVGEKAFLFTGDAEADSEEEMLDLGYSVDADVLKLGHHGSSTSNSMAFLEAVSPQTAIVSCGAGNDYGHPHQEVMDRLAQLNVTVYRTDTQGSILARCDGSSITFETDLPSVGGEQ